MATQDEQTAAFAVAQADIIKIVKEFAPAFFVSQIETAIQTRPDLVQTVVDDVLAAAERARGVR